MAKVIMKVGSVVQGVYSAVQNGVDKAFDVINKIDTSLGKLSNAITRRVRLQWTRVPFLLAAAAWYFGGGEREGGGGWN